MDQGSAPIGHQRGPLDFFAAPPAGGKLAARIKNLRSRLWLLAVVLVGCAVYLYFISAGGLRSWPIYGTYLDLQADGFRSGHLYLPLKPAPELLRAVNPRDRVNIRYWALDLSYFEGKYYTYWGPVPALFQALGKSLLGITRSIGDQYIGLFAACLTVLSGGLIIERMGRRLFGAVPRVVLIFGILAFACANPMLHNVTTAGTYVSAILSAQAFLVLGVLFAFDVVWYAGTSSARRYRLWLTGLCWGLALASRVTVLPTIAVLIGVTALGEGWVSERRWFRTFISALWLGVPVAIIGVGLLIYNQLRFNDPLQFGLNLQLSGYPPMRFERQYWLPNLYSYSLRSFVASCQFPYVYQTWWIKPSAAFPDGFPLPADYNTDEPVVGWLRAVPITWLIGFAFLLVPRRLTRQLRHGRVYLWCLVSFGAMGTLTGLTAIGVYATTMRYLGDVTAGLVLLGLLGAFALRASPLGLSTPKLTTSAVVLLSSITIVMGCLLGYQGYNAHFHKYNPTLDAAFVKALSFCGNSDPKLPRFWP
ncbi:MAG: hypothetical protein WDO74_26490 [Pseudomonadota bacterium]